MTEFVLVVIVSMGLADDPTSFEVRLTKETHEQCVQDSKSYKTPFPQLQKIISVETRCVECVKDSTACWSIEDYT